MVKVKSLADLKQVKKEIEAQAKRRCRAQGGGVAPGAPGHG